MNETQTIIPVILCGGSGTRLWPASRVDHPKQFLSLMNDRSLLQNTAKRALKLAGAPAENLVTVTLDGFKDTVIHHLSGLEPRATRHLLGEPSARNTAAAIAYAAEYVAATFGPGAILWIFPSDHHIEDEDILAQTLSYGLPAAQSGALVTFGITPDRPETDYGYIRLGEPASHTSVFAASEFTEKPTLEVAASYVESEQYLWNSGMFLLRADAVLSAYESHAANILSHVRAALAKGSAHRPDPDTYQAIKSEPFDKAIMEKSDRVCVVPMDAGWSDIGTWESLWSIRAKDKNHNVIDGKAACYNAQGNLVMAKDRLVAISGLDNIVVIETDDAILIGDKRDTKSLKALVSGLNKAGAPEAARAASSSRQAGGQPWTMVKSIPSENALQAKELTLAGGETITRAGQQGPAFTLLTVLDGEVSLSYDGQARTLSSLQSAAIPQGAAWTLSTPPGRTARLIEVQKPQENGIFFANPSRKIA